MFLSAQEKKVLLWSGNNHGRKAWFGKWSLLFLKICFCSWQLSSKYVRSFYTRPMCPPPRVFSCIKHRTAGIQWLHLRRRGVHHSAYHVGSAKYVLVEYFQLQYANSIQDILIMTIATTSNLFSRWHGYSLSILPTVYNLPLSKKKTSPSEWYLLRVSYS